MMAFAMVLPCVLLIGCRTTRNADTTTLLSVDSAAQSSVHSSIAQAYQSMRKLDFDFDTLNITIERGVADAVPETVKVRAVKGRIVSSKESHKYAAAHDEMHDTIAYKQTRADRLAEHTATTQVYNPPNVTAIGAIALLVIVLLVCFNKIK